MDREELQSLARLLVYGSPNTRRLTAERLLQEGDSEQWALLIDTIQNDGPWQLRARCLEVLGLAIGSASKEKVETLLTMLVKPHEQ